MHLCILFHGEPMYAYAGMWVLGVACNACMLRVCCVCAAYAACVLRVVLHTSHNIENIFKVFGANSNPLFPHLTSCVLLHHVVMSIKTH